MALTTYAVKEILYPMQEQFFTQFIHIFKQVFLQNLDGSFSLFSGYASGLFYGIATIELVIVGLLIALSSNTTIYTLLTRLIKISLFFFVVFHFSDLFQLFLNSIKYISAHTLTSAGDISGTSDTFKLSSLWDFNNPSNYVTQGLSQSLDSLSSLHSTVQNTTPHINNTINTAAQSWKNTQHNTTTGLSGTALLQLGKTLVIALTGILAIANILLFYFTALIALLISPFGQLSFSAGIFQASFSKFISAGLRLMTFIVVFILFNTFYTKLSQAIPDLLSSGTQQVLNTATISGDALSQTQKAIQPASLVSFLMALLGLCLCWIIPKEVSQRAGILSIPDAPKDSTPPITTNMNTPQTAPTIMTPMQTYTNMQSSPNMALQAPPLPQTSQTSAQTSSTVNVTSPQLTTNVSVSSSSGGGSGKFASTTKKNDDLRKQTGFAQQRFSQERASKLRQNFHSAVEKSEK